MDNMAPFYFLFVGLLLIFLEFYLPGGIMGGLGALVLLASIVVFAIQYQSPLLIFLYTAGTFILLALLFKYAMWKIRTAKPERSVYSDAHQEGFAASSYDEAAIGKAGVVDTDLRPGGRIIVEGKRHTAISRSGYLPKGTKVTVIGGEGESLTVKKQSEDGEI